MKCNCGRKTNSLIYRQGKRYCQKCNTQGLSGQWERGQASERAKYAADLIQPKDAENFKKVYGEKAYTKATKGY